MIQPQSPATEPPRSGLPTPTTAMIPTEAPVYTPVETPMYSVLKRPIVSQSLPRFSEVSSHTTVSVPATRLRRLPQVASTQEIRRLPAITPIVRLPAVSTPTPVEIRRLPTVQEQVGPTIRRLPEVTNTAWRYSISSH
jgi:hypothetical protein